MVRWLIPIGMLLVLLGLVTGAAGRWPLLSWLGRLPGDIRIEGERFRLYIPITTCLVVSLVLSVLIRLFRR